MSNPRLRISFGVEDAKLADLFQLQPPHSSTKAAPPAARGLYWCWLINEPFIIAFRNGIIPYCQNCDGNLDFVDGKINEPGTHSFVAQVHKPREVP